MRSALRRLLAGLVALSPLASFALGAPTELRGAPEDVGGLCWFNPAGLGSCIDFFASCFEAEECDSATACPAGDLCVRGTSCFSNLFGVCLPESDIDAACSNPGTLETGTESCAPILFHEDFTPPPITGPDPPPPAGLHKLTVHSICGLGSALFGDNTCGATLGAPSRPWTARWGLTSSCTSYALAGNSQFATTGPIDISSCDGAVLDFDYNFFVQEGPAYDRGYVLVRLDGGFREVIATGQSLAGPYSGSAASCGGVAPGSTVLPVGNLLDDDTWHHFRAGIGKGSTVEVEFRAETFDGMFNEGQGLFFDDVRIDCGDLIHQDGFEGGNLLRWSATTAPPVQMQIFEIPSSCSNTVQCGGPDSACFSFTSTEGLTWCLTAASDLCAGTPCPGGSGDCAAGEVCVIDGCCVTGPTEGLGVPVCVPQGCDPHAELLAGPTSARSRR